MPTPHVAIVLVNYKGRDDTLECLQSLRGLTYPAFSVWVVDQNSGDGTVEAVEALAATWEPGKLQIIANRENSGFAGGNNVGIRAALDAGADYVFLLNNDTIVPPDLLKPLISLAESDAKIGVVGPTMFYHAAPETIWASGGKMGGRGQSTLLRDGESAASEPPEPVEVDFIVGAGLMAKRAVWEQVGLLDERYFLYYEEADWCARARENGWRIVHCPASRLWHKVSQSTGGTESAMTQYYMRRNALLYVGRHKGRAALWGLLGESIRLALVWTVQKKTDKRRILIKAMRDYLQNRLGKADF